ncbi:hypothetical protein [Maritimibacter sp. UBA3975]|mgnify:CR=1 FL=1|uniref:hypothetical protein n=1 Tax=Maritimibacter sp. UBA3975 TaxID=1946833 RepID=UPI000C08E1FF|nr:hypothetical protein [Maritimibacter sp. UBA3975]MAM60259.1 hypothetical protein [Maritimibacter sp.]|tara:strand:+ start:5622 stop:5801 length:180 start_codon:yes stop_codon:yes gene_type:complete
MTEVLFSIGIIGLAAAGLGAGLLMGRAPAKTSCGAADGIAKTRCADCPLRRKRTAEETP